VSGGARQNVADTKLVPVSEDDDTSQTAAEMRSLADQAEAEAAEAEALAAAARARARAIQLRRGADLADAKAQPVAAAVTKEAVAEEAVTDDEEATREVAPEDTESAGEPEDLTPEEVETEESPDEAIEGSKEPDTDASSIDDAEEKPERGPDGPPSPRPLRLSSFSLRFPAACTWFWITVMRPSNVVGRPSSPPRRGKAS
jgi:Mce-associated membrane protein